MVIAQSLEKDRAVARYEAVATKLEEAMTVKRYNHFTPQSGTNSCNLRTCKKTVGNGAMDLSKHRL